MGREPEQPPPPEDVLRLARAQLAQAGGHARAKALSPQQRIASARKAGRARGRQLKRQAAERRAQKNKENA